MSTSTSIWLATGHRTSLNLLCLRVSCKWLLCPLSGTSHLAMRKGLQLDSSALVRTSKPLKELVLNIWKWKVSQILRSSACVASTSFNGRIWISRLVCTLVVILLFQCFPQSLISITILWFSSINASQSASEHCSKHLTTRLDSLNLQFSPFSITWDLFKFIVKKRVLWRKGISQLFFWTTLLSNDTDTAGSNYFASRTPWQ